MTVPALLIAGFLVLPQSVGLQEGAGRPAAPYSLPPLSSDGSTGGATAAVESVVELDDSVPLPAPPVRRTTPDGDVEEQPASGDPFFLSFAAGPRHPAPGEVVDPALYDNALASYPDGRPTPDTYAFVMFSKRMTRERLAQLEGLGCRPLGFHPHYTQKVALPSAAVDQVAALDFVRWVGVPEPWQKVHPALAAHLAAAVPNQPIEVWVNVFESDVGPGSVRRTVAGPSERRAGGGTLTGPPIELADVWITNGWQQAALEGAGLDVRDFAGRVNAFRARMMPAGLALVTDLDFVQFVELDAEARPFAHDETMAMVGLDRVRATWDGGTSQTAIVGVVDGGLEWLHPDINANFTRHVLGWDISGSPSGNPLEDLCGHGTHVVGTVLGAGVVEPGHTGAAPGLATWTDGHLYSVRVFEDCDPQPVDEAAVLAITSSGWGSTPRPHLINNSWGTDPIPGSPWFGTETEPRLYDDNAYADAQLNVFAAGNQGPTPGSIGLQASSKNSLTVGSVVDFEEPLAGGEAGLLAVDSARGPLADGRWKPNVVAPGEMVTSADAFDLNGYDDRFGTSMAAPHVTGLAADLIDGYPTLFPYLPERISAHVMATAYAKDDAVLSTASNSHLDQYGTGRIDADRCAIGSSGTWWNWAFSASSSGGYYGNFAVPAGTTRLVVVMHYVEGSASAGAGSALVDDWDLWIDQPPLTPGTNTGEWSAQQSSIDNTEVRVLTNPNPGGWQWKMHPSSATGLVYAGVSAYVQLGDPSTTVDLTSSSYYLKPLQTVQVEVDVDAADGPASAVFLDTNAPGAVYLKAETDLLDGPIASLLDNEHMGSKLMLGTVDSSTWRKARWWLSWPSEGWQVFNVDAESETAVTQSDFALFIVDGTQPGTVTDLASPSHYGQWSNDTTVDLTWTAAVDPVSNGTTSGLAGYAHSVTQGAAGTPATIQTLGGVTSYTTPPLGNGQHWFNIRAADNSGNWGDTVSLQGIKIDTLQPGIVSNLTSTTHTLGVSSCDPDIVFTWDPAQDNGGAGIAGYGVKFSGSPAATAPTFVNETGTTATKSGATAGSWYAHVRAIDNAGNPGNQVTAGPYPVDPDPTSIYCTAKTNSQGCTPKIGYTGAPSLSGGAFTVTASEVLNNKSGLVFWGTTPSATPFQGGTKCVANPVKRTPIQNSGGNPPPDDCSGSYSFAFGTSYMNAKGIGAGDTLHAQWWSRDPSAPFSTGLTDALSFTVCP